MGSGSTTPPVSGTTARPRYRWRRVSAGSAVRMRRRLRGGVGQGRNIGRQAGSDSRAGRESSSADWLTYSGGESETLKVHLFPETSYETVLMPRAEVLKKIDEPLGFFVECTAYDIEFLKNF
jgi:hypothetical protein